jgi:hypothetical protein
LEAATLLGLASRKQTPNPEAIWGDRWLLLLQ